MAKRAKKTGSKRGGAKGAKAGADTEDRTVRPSEVRKMMPGTVIKSLFAEMKKTKNIVGTAAGELGAEIKEKCDKFHFSKSIIRLGGKLNNLPPEKLVFELEDLAHMLEASGLNDRAASAPRMQFGPGEEGEEGGEGEAGEGEEGDGEPTGNVRRLRAAE